MSNRLHINRLKIENLDDGGVTFGVRVSDDYEDYMNDCIFDKKGEFVQELPSDKVSILVLLLQIADSSQTLCDLLDSHSGSDGGAYLGNDWVDGEDLSVLLMKAEATDARRIQIEESEEMMKEFQGTDKQ